MRIHFIAIGGAVMHQLAIALKQKGYDVSGSDDEIFEPAKGNLGKFNLLPDLVGWNARRINDHIDAVILGMHARNDNPELIRARELNLKIYSYPEFLFELNKNKLRVVIAGSHGKTTITSMIVHILNQTSIKFDYLVGAAIPGLNQMIRISDDAEIIIFEGDEYPDSAINRSPKFLIYQPQMVLISGIAWDHINVYPTLESYMEPFRHLIQSISPEGTLIYNNEDEELKKLIAENSSAKSIEYSTPDYNGNENATLLKWNSKVFPLQVFGRHNLQNAMGAVAVCKELKVAEEFSFHALKNFSGAAKRLQLLAKSDHCAVYLDFAHAPSKVRATVQAVREKHPDWKLIACLELHTFSSLHRDFISEYKNTLQDADEKIIFYSAHTFELKKMPALDEDFIRNSFGDAALQIFTDPESLSIALKNKNFANTALLLMSSGNFGGLNTEQLVNFACPK